MTALPKFGGVLPQRAAAYAAQGWHIFPLVPKGKVPMVKAGGGFLSATNDANQVADWWRRWPNANIGLWPGSSGFVVIDVDGPEGEETARALGLLAEPTLVCTTGRPEGGRHLYYHRPDFQVSNCNIGHKLDVRGDGGYVILPPSIHPTGTPYRWLGRADEIKPLPPRALEAIRLGQIGQGPANEHAARDIVLEDIGEGGRNNSLTRYAGRLLAKGITPEEALVMLSAVNLTLCKPPLPQKDVNTIIAGISRREQAKRTTDTGNTLAVVGERHEPQPDSLPDFATLGAEQIEGARTLIRRDLTDAPTWGWLDLQRLSGPMLPGELLIVASLMGNGKSTLLMSQMDRFAEAKVGTLYIPLEIDPEICRTRWAAWKLGLDVAALLRGEWEKLPEGSREAMDGVLDEQQENPFVHFASPRRITYHELSRWCRKAVDEYQTRVIMLDHLHRMQFGGDAASFRVTVTEVVRQLKDLARELGIVLLCAAQLNRSADVLDRHLPPQVHRLKESAGIAEEADVVLMLSRRLAPQISDAEMKDFRMGRKSERDIEDPNTMAITCRKHRLDDTARDRTVLLHVRNGKLEDRVPSWRPTEYNA